MGCLELFGWQFYSILVVTNPAVFFLPHPPDHAILILYIFQKRTDHPLFPSRKWRCLRSLTGAGFSRVVYEERHDYNADPRPPTFDKASICLAGILTSGRTFRGVFVGEGRKPMATR